MGKAATAGEPKVLAGQVTDLRGRPLSGVEVRARSWQSEPLGAGRSDAQGRFTLALQRVPQDITLAAEPPGYQGFALTGFRCDGKPVQLRLTRRIDDKYLAELLAESDLGRFRDLVADLLSPSTGTIGETLPLPEVFPALGGLRKKLRALLPADLSQLQKPNLPQEQVRAQEKLLLLLAYYSDPEDEELLSRWIAGPQRTAQRPAQPCRGATVDAAWRAWEVLHFAKEGYPPGTRTPFSSTSMLRSPDGQHAVVTHSVRYAHWGYSQEIVLVQKGATWEVKLILAGERWHAAR